MHIDRMFRTREILPDIPLATELLPDAAKQPFFDGKCKRCGIISRAPAGRGCLVGLLRALKNVTRGGAGPAFHGQGLENGAPTFAAGCRRQLGEIARGLHACLAGKAEAVRYQDGKTFALLCGGIDATKTGQGGPSRRASTLGLVMARWRTTMCWNASHLLTSSRESCPKAGRTAELEGGPLFLTGTVAAMAISWAVKRKRPDSRFA